MTTQDSADLDTTGPAIRTPAGGPRGLAADIGGRVERNLAKIHDGTSAGAVFGPAEYVGDKAVICAAAVQRAGGFGFGAGDDADGGGGGGGGGGGHSDARPVAVITVDSSGVSVRPVVDFTKIGITLIAGLFAIWRAGRRK